MMTAARPYGEGLQVFFADGCSGVVPMSDVPEIGTLADLDGVELPNPFEVVLRRRDGSTVEVPWDFVRHYCDASYRGRVEAVAASGRRELGERLRLLRESLGQTQEQLASRAGIGRVTLSRIENGEQSPRYETLAALADALGYPLSEVLV
jgi:DNA-binding XRE family transcriptional regulator